MTHTATRARRTRRPAKRSWEHPALMRILRRVTRTIRGTKTEYEIQLARMTPKAPYDWITLDTVDTLQAAEAKRDEIAGLLKPGEKTPIRYRERVETVRHDFTR